MKAVLKVLCEPLMNSLQVEAVFWILSKESAVVSHETLDQWFLIKWISCVGKRLQKEHQFILIQVEQLNDSLEKGGLEIGEEREHYKMLVECMNFIYSNKILKDPVGRSVEEVRS